MHHYSYIKVILKVTIVFKWSLWYTFMLEFISLSPFFFKKKKKDTHVWQSLFISLSLVCMCICFSKKKCLCLCDLLFAQFFFFFFFLAVAIYLLNFKRSVLLNHSELGSSSQAVILKLVVNPYRDLNNFFSYIKIFSFRNKTIESTIYYL